MPCASPIHAAALVHRHLRERSETVAWGVAEVFRVLDGDALPEGAGVVTYRPTYWDFPSGHWVAFVAGGVPLVLKSSSVYGVAKDTGEVSYFGDAGDEG